MVTAAQAYWLNRKRRQKRAASEGVGVVYDPEAVAFWTRFSTPPSDARKALLSTFFTATSAQRAKLDLFYLLDAADNQAARQNLIADLYNLTAVNAPTFVADRGYNGDGASASLSTGFNQTTSPTPKIALNAASMGVWVTGLASTSRNGIATTRVGTETTPTTYIRANDTTTNNTAIVAGARLIAWTRNAAGQYDIYVNGAFLATVSVTSTSITNAVVSLLGIPGVSFSAGQEAMFFLGGALTAGDHLAIYNAALAYHQAVGAA